MFARFFEGKTFREELLSLLPLPGRKTGEIVFKEMTQFGKKGLDLSKIESVGSINAGTLQEFGK